MDLLALWSHVLFVHVPCLLLLLVILAFVSHPRCLHKRLYSANVVCATTTGTLIAIVLLNKR